MQENQVNKPVPEDLQFREEFADQGIKRLHSARLWLFWRRVGLVLGTAVIGLIWWANNRDQAIRKISFDRISQVQSQEFDTHVEDSVFDAPSSSFSTQENRVESSKTDKIFQVKTFGQGGSVSSGAESPGRKSNSSSLNEETSNLTSSTQDVDSQSESKRMESNSLAVEDGLNISSIPEHMDLPLHRANPLVEKHSTIESSVKASSFVPQRRQHLYVTLGTILTKGFGTVRDWIHPDPMVSLNLSHRLNAVNDIHGSIGAMRIAGIDRSVEVLQESYSLGYSQRKLTYHTDALYFLTAKIHWSHSIRPGWRVSAGPSAMLLLQGENHISEQISGTFDTPKSTVTRTRGYVKGFQQIALGVDFGVERALSSKLYLGVDASIGLNDMTKSGVFTQDNFDRNGYIGCHIRHQLF